MMCINTMQLHIKLYTVVISNLFKAMSTSYEYIAVVKTEYLSVIHLRVFFMTT